MQISRAGAARLAAEASEPGAFRQMPPPGGTDPAATAASGRGDAEPAAAEAQTAAPDGDAAAAEAQTAAPDGDAAGARPGDPSARDPAGRPLSPPELRQVRELQRRDAEVRAHEQAHLSAAGSHARGGAQMNFQRGPDGRSYAVGGEVSIDAGAEPDPHRTQTKMRQVRRAALAPAEPSAQDRRIAAKAASRGNAAAMDIRALAQAERAIEQAERSGDERAAAMARQEIERRGGDPPPEDRTPEAAADRGVRAERPGQQALRVDVSA
ncbi:MAG: putative metalloprotease CJM1_0395 family protein [Planctomycetota bacterium]